jgi:uncharacterized protein YfdQ (DUF2303 family)
MATDDGIKAALVAGEALAGAAHRVFDVHGVPMVLVPPGHNMVLPSDAIDRAERLADKPTRRMGQAIHTELASFVEHVNRFRSKDSAVWANTAGFQLTAVLNYHPAGPDGAAAAWSDHRALYTAPRSDAWKVWSERDGKTLRQDALADFLEARLDDLVSDGDKKTSMPPPAAVLEMARNLQVHTKGRFERQVNPVTGEFSMICKQENEASSTPIPRAFLIGIPVFEGGDVYRVEVRVRFQMQDGAPLFALAMHRRAEIERDAFAGVRAAVIEKTKLPMFAGAPE